MQIFIKTAEGSPLSLDVEETHTIKAVKAQIQCKLSIAPEQQRLTLRGKSMEDTLTLADYKLRGSSLLSMAKSQGAMAKMMMDNRTLILEVCSKKSCSCNEVVEAFIAQNIARTALLSARQSCFEGPGSNRALGRSELFCPDSLIGA